MTIAVRKKPRHQHGIWPDFENLLNEFMHTGMKDIIHQKNLSYTLPHVNILEFEDYFTIQLAVPGISKKEVSIKVDKDELIISSDFKRSDTPKFLLREYNYGTFERRFRLNPMLDSESIKANMKSGILSIKIPKKDIDKAPMNQKIKIK